MGSSQVDRVQLLQPTGQVHAIRWAAALEQGANRLRQTGDRFNLLLLLRLFADASLKISLVTQALNLVDEAIDLSHETQIIYDKPELIRL